MFCKNCGKEIADDAKFCPSCGASLVSTLAVPDNDQTSGQMVDYSGKYLTDENRSLVLSALDEAHVVLSDAYKYFIQADEVTTQAQKWSRFFNGNLIQKIATFIVGLLFLRTGISHFLEGDMRATDILFVLLFVSIGVLLILLLFIPHIIQKNSEAKCVNLQNRANDILKKNYEKIYFLDEEYWNPAAVEYLGKVLASGRARTWREATDMCDTYLHRMRMENNQQVQLDYLKEIEYNTIVAAQAASAAAAASWMNFFF